MTSARELESQVTPLTYAGLTSALVLHWDCTGESPTRAAVELKVAHIAHEADFARCRCFNLGGVKSEVGGRGVHCWQFFTTTEVLSVSRVEVEMTKTDLIDIIEPVKRDGRDHYRIRVRPKHPWCCFRAFESLSDAVRDQLLFVYGRSAAWQALRAGNLQAYATELGCAKYYTADPASYAEALRYRLRLARAALAKFDWGDVT